MKSLLNVALGVLLGVAGCLGYYFYENYEQEKKGLKRGWVPLGGSPAAIAAKPSASGPAAAKPASPRPAQPPAVTPKAPSSATAKPAMPQIKPEFYKRLAAEWWRWPATITVRNEQKIRFNDPSGGFVIFPISAGATVGVYRMDTTGTKVFVRAKGSPFSFPILLSVAETDLLARAKPEGTPRPPSLVVKPVTSTGTSRTKPANSGRTSTSARSPRSDGANAPDEANALALPQPPQVSGPAPTLFGVPIQ